MFIIPNHDTNSYHATLSIRHSNDSVGRSWKTKGCFLKTRYYVPADMLLAGWEIEDMMSDSPACHFIV